MSWKLIFFISVLMQFDCMRPTIEAANILAVYPFPGKSHFMMHNALIGELVRRGHRVTMVTAYSLESLQLGGNYTEILINPVYDFWHDVQSHFAADNLFELTSMGMMDFLKMLEIIGTKTTDHALKQPKVMELIHAPKDKRHGVFDLLLAEQFYQEAFLPLAQLYNVPVVTSTTLGYQNHMSQMMGVLSPWSFVPHGFLPFTDHMSFIQRFLNTFYSLYEDMDREFNYFPKMDALVAKHYADVELDRPIPSVSIMEKNISAILLNSYAPLTTVRPKIDGMIPVGGMHIYPPKPLPKDIQVFLDGAINGTIFFSLGSNVQSKDMPPPMLRIFLDVFAGMRERIVWKFENENIAGLPSNVLVRKWLPQSDILAHPSIKVFISHGGLFGTQEAVYHGVPILGMPFYCDQHLNINKAVQIGYAISLRFQSITSEILKNALTTLIEDPKYRQNIQRASKIFRDRPVSARDTAVYWIEHVIRHKGAPHLRSAGMDLRWYQFYLLDIIAVTVLAVLGGPLILCFCLRRALCRDRRRRKPKQS